MMTDPIDETAGYVYVRWREPNRGEIGWLPCSSICTSSLAIFPPETVSMYDRSVFAFGNEIWVKKIFSIGQTATALGSQLQRLPNLDVTGNKRFGKFQLNNTVPVSRAHYISIGPAAVSSSTPLFHNLQHSLRNTTVVLQCLHPRLLDIATINPPPHRASSPLLGPRSYQSRICRFGSCKTNITVTQRSSPNRKFFLSRPIATFNIGRWPPVITGLNSNRRDFHSLTTLLSTAYWLTGLPQHQRMFNGSLLNRQRLKPV